MELVERGLARSRAAAQRAIEDGGVTVGGIPASKAATLVDRSTPIALAPDDRPWAGRGGAKLTGALDVLDAPVSGRKALDVGASTGGFTDVLLARGAASVTAVDVGYGQLLWRLRNDPRVEVFDRTNFRTVDPAAIGAPFDVVTVDVSFISVSLLAAPLAACGEPGTDYLVLVKPQFEVGRERVGPGGIVADDTARAAAVSSVAEALRQSGLPAQGVAPSVVAGAKGNREVFLHARHSASGAMGSDAITAAVVG